LRRLPSALPAFLLVTVVALACTSGGATIAPVGTAPAAAPATSAAPTDTSLPATPEATLMPTPGPFTLTSPAFTEGAAIPREYSCDGANVSPELKWSGVPEGTGALVLLVDDPDAGNFVHWIVLDLPPGDGGLPKDVAPTANPPQQGRNGFGHVGWGGPCPPSGSHHYRFTLTAIGSPLGLAGNPDGSTLRAALSKAQTLGTATLTGTYRRGG
jgi:Raf kinase inhibitor-like YbhB/YbcL family protein